MPGKVNTKKKKYEEERMQSGVSGCMRGREED